MDICRTTTHKSSYRKKAQAVSILLTSFGIKERIRAGKVRRYLTLSCHIQQAVAYDGSVRKYPYYQNIMSDMRKIVSQKGLCVRFFSNFAKIFAEWPQTSDIGNITLKWIVNQIHEACVDAETTI